MMNRALATVVAVSLSAVACTTATPTRAEAEPTEAPCYQSPVCQAAVAAALVDQQKVLTREFNKILRRQVRHDMRLFSDALAECEGRNR